MKLLKRNINEKVIFESISNKLSDIDKEISDEYLNWLDRKTSYFKNTFFKTSYGLQPDNISRGDVVWVEFGINVGTELSDFNTKGHFAVVWAIDLGNIIVIPLSSRDSPGSSMTFDLGYIEEIVGVDNRLTKRQFADYIILDDAYNSNMLGVEYALEVLKEYDGKRFILTPGLVEMDIKMDSLASRYAKLIDESCDFCILIENTFTKCMVKYINKCKVFLVKTFSLGFSLFMRIKEKNSALLIENDLPDAY